MTVGATTVPIFQPTLPMRKATLPPSQQGQPRLISIPTSYAGGDAARSTSHRLRSYFNPHLLCGRRLVSRLDGAMGQNFNPRSPCGERPAARIRATKLQAFQPTLPMRGATSLLPLPHNQQLFQPTLPMRGATLTTSITRYRLGIFNPRSPCGERIIINPTFGDFFDFNPRSPCGERLAP